jgi:GntR family histidine utilization transcriptional repressor
MTEKKKMDLGTTVQPLYQKVKAFILEQVDNGRLKPNSRVPSENELVQTLEVSRMTVNRALRELTAEGRLVRVQGVGTFVAPDKPQSALLEIVSIAEEIRRRGGVHNSKVQLLQSEQVPKEVAIYMRLPAGTPVYHALLVHYDRTVPVQLADRYVNPAVAPDFLNQDFARITPNAYLMRVAPVNEVDHVIEAVLADKTTQRLLKIKENTPCLVLHRTTWSGDLVATHSRFTYPGPRYKLGGRFKPDTASHRTVA